MKNLQIVIAQALHSYELEHIEQSISHEINNTILEIVVNDESFEKIDCYLYSKKDPKKILKSSIHYVIALLERAKYRVEKAQQNNVSPLHICLYVIKKIEGFIAYLQTKF
ncbi:hypothetical protein EGK58_007280 [Acinetobacter variabilis]|jgi:hypothetical protein|uniref:hypothetical protein n=1 Tax=Acinetobacter variabilis TaxID=70346 RepID=UPI000F65D33D|nr:hypothetical protein [Acinetobacter variabilis]MCU4630084.1 hypothetical protein [Acinetobacter variabilis]QXR20655.1 hypothetical protein EGK58_007280 [Acinetobacter variabilis]